MQGWVPPGTTVGPQDFSRLTHDLIGDVKITEVDESSLFCEIVCNKRTMYDGATAFAFRKIRLVIEKVCANRYTHTTIEFHSNHNYSQVGGALVGLWEVSPKRFPESLS